MQILVGLMLDRFGGKWLMVWASLIVGAGCFIPSLTDSFGMLIAARMMMGLGSAFAFIGTVYLAAVWFPKSRLAFFSGMTTGLGMMGAMIGQAPLAWLVGVTGWQHSFLIAGFFGIAVAVALYLVIPAHPAWEIARRESYLRENQSHHFLSALKAVFLNPQTWMIGFIACALYMPLAVFGDLWGVEYIQAITHESPTAAAGAVSMLYVGWLIGGPTWGLVSDRIRQRRKPMMLACLATAISIGVLLSFSYLPIEVMYGLLLLIGICSSVQVVAFVANVEISPGYSRGSALAITNMIVMFLGGLFQWIVGVILTNLGDDNMANDANLEILANNFRIAMLVLPAIAILGSLTSYFMKETYRESHH
ncbi:MAG: hypothetical protein B7X06_03265 [Verrucomicrobia bacterium 21-51-4]|nr:MAG: hypothetical protein B7X06_03265 [Verrucomicrobia bacterium 21-51-4]